jgi:FKBP-type peptidyl-prolyl cis-trans isomerase
LIIPYSLAYGESGKLSGTIYAIQPFETLVFDIEVVSVKTQIDPEEPI